MKDHFSDIQQLVSKGIKSGSQAGHFGLLFSSKLSPTNLRRIQKFEVVWQGNPISAVKTLGDCTCQLFLREKLEKAKASKNEPGKLINSCSEIHGGSRHKPKLHRCKEEAGTPSTDALDKSKRSNVAGGGGL